jgi:transposase
VALAKSRTIEEVKSKRNEATAMEVYARRQGTSKLIQNTAVVKSLRFRNLRERFQARRLLHDEEARPVKVVNRSAPPSGQASFANLCSFGPAP